jgi:hypothetical protein
MEWFYIVPPIAIVAVIILVLWKNWQKMFEMILFIAKPATDIAEKLVPDDGGWLDKLSKWAKIAVVNMEVLYKKAKESTEKGTEERDKLNKEIEDRAIEMMKELADVDGYQIPSHITNAARGVVKYEVETFLKKLQEAPNVVVIAPSEEAMEETPEVKLDPLSAVPTESP